MKTPSRTTWTPERLTGLDATHVVADDDLACSMTPLTLEAFQAMRAAASREGFDLQVASAFRDFSRQARIWNAKFRGERPVYDRHGNALDHASLASEDLIDAILAWSALPGASRHHWGTDVDVFDGARVATRADVKLLPEESAPGGVFAALHSWLDREMGRFGFYRPYDVWRGGLNAEPWHLSFQTEAADALQALTPAAMAEGLANAPQFDGSAAVLPRLADIHARYVTNVASG